MSLWTTPAMEHNTAILWSQTKFSSLHNGKHGVENFWKFYEILTRFCARIFLKLNNQTKSSSAFICLHFVLFTFCEICLYFLSKKLERAGKFKSNFCLHSHKKKRGKFEQNNNNWDWAWTYLSISKVTLSPCLNKTLTL